MRFLTLFAAAALLSACASQTPYAPAGANGFGYSEQAIEKGRYRVSFQARDALTAEDGALRRAAELTSQNGYDHFIVVSRDRSAAAGRSRSSIGIGGGSIGRRSGVGVGVNVPVGGQSQTLIVRLEIIMGAGPRPDDPNAYDAASILSNLG